MASFVVAEDALGGVYPEGVAAVAALLQAAPAAAPGAAASRVELGAFLAARCPALACFSTGGFAPPAEGVPVVPGVPPLPAPPAPFDGLAAAAAALRHLQGAEVWALHGAWVDKHRGALAAATRERLDFAASVSSPAAAAAAAARLQVRSALGTVLRGGAVLVLPTVGAPPPATGRPAAESTAWRASAMRLLSVVGMGGLCCVHGAPPPVLALRRYVVPDSPFFFFLYPLPPVPVGVDDAGAPVGVSVCGPRGADLPLLRLAAALAQPAARAFTAARAPAAAAPAAAAGAAASPALAGAAVASLAPPLVGARDGTSDEAAAAAAKAEGNAAFAEGQWADAAAAYGSGLRLQPRSAVLLANRAQARLRLGDFAGAVDDCTACLAVDGRSVKALLRRGTARASLGHLSAALADFEAAKALEPANKAAGAEVRRLRALVGGQGA